MKIKKTQGPDFELFGDILTPEEELIWKEELEEAQRLLTDSGVSIEDVERKVEEIEREEEEEEISHKEKSPVDRFRRNKQRELLSNPHAIEELYNSVLLRLEKGENPEKIFKYLEWLYGVTVKRKVEQFVSRTREIQREILKLVQERYAEGIPLLYKELVSEFSHYSAFEFFSALKLLLEKNEINPYKSTVEGDFVLLPSGVQFPPTETSSLFHDLLKDILLDVKHPIVLKEPPVTLDELIEEYEDSRIVRQVIDELKRRGEVFETSHQGNVYILPRDLPPNVLPYYLLQIKETPEKEHEEKMLEHQRSLEELKAAFLRRFVFQAIKALESQNIKIMKASDITTTVLTVLAGAIRSNYLRSEFLQQLSEERQKQLGKISEETLRGLAQLYEQLTVDASPVEALLDKLVSEGKLFAFKNDLGEQRYISPERKRKLLPTEHLFRKRRLKKREEPEAGEKEFPRKKEEEEEVQFVSLEDLKYKI